MEGERYAPLFRNGRNQALRSPREFEFRGDVVVVRKEGSACTDARYDRGPADRRLHPATAPGIRSSLNDLCESGIVPATS
jgi:hypothetical protein